MTASRMPRGSRSSKQARPREERPSTRRSNPVHITGAGTVIADNRQLTDRSGLPRRRPLVRVILDRRGRLSNFQGAVVFRGDLTALSTELYAREMQCFLLECGPDLAFNALRAGII